MEWDTCTSCEGGGVAFLLLCPHPALQGLVNKAASLFLSWWAGLVLFRLQGGNTPLCSLCLGSGCWLLPLEWWLLVRAVCSAVESNVQIHLGWNSAMHLSKAFDMSSVPCWCSRKVQGRGFVLSLVGYGPLFLSGWEQLWHIWDGQYWPNSFLFECCFLTHFSKAESKVSFSFIPFVM